MGTYLFFPFIQYHAQWLAGKNVSDLTYFCMQWDVEPQLVQSTGSIWSLIVTHRVKWRHINLL